MFGALQHRDTAPRPQAAPAAAYASVRYPVKYARAFSVGTPVVLHHRIVGEVLSVVRQGRSVTLQLVVEPRVGPLLARRKTYPVKSAGHVYLNIGRPPRPRPQSAL